MATGNIGARTSIGRQFCERYNYERSIFISAIGGIDDEADRQRYASLLILRVMFLYFLQDGGLQSVVSGDRAHQSEHMKIWQRAYQSGPTPFLNISLFQQHGIERDNPAIEIPDDAFEQLCAFFDDYQWQLDEDAASAKTAITPAVLSLLFEQRANKKQMGSYFTREDISGYIAVSTIIPYLLGVLEKRCTSSLLPGCFSWQLLRDNSSHYLYPSFAHGNAVPLPGEIATGKCDISRRARWDQPAQAACALPGESWRDVVARRQQYDEVVAKLQAGKIDSIDDLITCNLDLRRFARDLIENCRDRVLLEALYETLSNTTILDPTCGGGAFLLAALKELEPLYDACLGRLEQLHDGKEAVEPGQSANRRYAIRKAILASNLYGVDIMEEAIELCRARLYLQLLARAESPRELEELPDLGQHIRTGNILIDDNTEGKEFSVIIGNPPYIEYENVSVFYNLEGHRLEGYRTFSTGNLYAMTVERCARLLQDDGRLGMILPASATCATGYQPLQSLLLENATLHIASFSDQRGKLFDIPHPRLCTILWHHSCEKSKVFTTTYIKAGRRSRATLFQCLQYCDVGKLVMPGIIPRYGSPVELTIHEKLYGQARCLGDFIAKHGEHSLYYTRKLSWFVQVTPFIPALFDERGEHRLPSELKTLYFTTSIAMQIAFVALNSHLFYWFITTRSDCRNLNAREVAGFPLDMDSITAEQQQELSRLAAALKGDLLAHAELREMHFRQYGTLTVQCLFPGRSSVILDKIDCVLGQVFGFNEEELDFLLHFDRKYRLARTFLQI